MRIEAGGHFTRAATTFSNNVALQTEEQSFTFAELRQIANKLGSGLLNHGIAQGDRVGVLSHNRVEVAELWLGLERSGIVRVVLHSHFDMAIHVQTLNHTGAVALAFDTRFSEAV